jgi:phosphoribosylformimino-5-aminoimidazole carboxamide ribotide isomerase
MRIIPAIDIIEGKCVRLSQGDYGQKKIYNENPLEVARNFEEAGLKYLHLVDLDGAKAGVVTNWPVVKEITSNTNLLVDFGGGIKTERDVQALLDIGVRQVNLGSIAVKQPEVVFRWIDKFGPEKIILSADVKNEMIQISGWQQNSNVGIIDFIRNFQSRGLEFVTCTDISTDGMLNGPNTMLYKKIIGAFPDIKLIASGGVSSAADLEQLEDEALFGVIVGKAIYENRVSLSELTKYQ